MMRGTRKLLVKLLRRCPHFDLGASFNCDLNLFSLAFGSVGPASDFQFLFKVSQARDGCYFF